MDEFGGFESMPGVGLTEPRRDPAGGSRPDWSWAPSQMEVRLPSH